MSVWSWAYVDCAGDGMGQAAGPTGSLQYLTGANSTSGSANLLYYTASAGELAASTLVLTGTLVVSGTVSASHYHIENVVEMDSTGSTSFGNTNDDIHERTGSLYVGRAGAGNTVLQADQSKLTTKVYGFASRYRKITGGTGTIASGDCIVACSGSGNQTIQLPSGSACLPGTHLLIKDEAFNRSASGKIFISASNHVAGYNIENRKFYVMVGTMPAINLYTDGTNWFVY